MRVRRLVGLVSACACGCPREFHRHNHYGRYCGRHEDCARWRPRLRRARLGNLTPDDLRLLAAGTRRTA